MHLSELKKNFESYLSAKQTHFEGVHHIKALIKQYNIPRAAIIAHLGLADRTLSNRFNNPSGFTDEEMYKLLDLIESYSKLPH